jgi:hypothetical protein
MNRWPPSTTAVARQPGREPTHTELVAAQRAARRLTEHSPVCIAHVSSGHVASRGAAVMAREDRRITDDQLVAAASSDYLRFTSKPRHPKLTSSSTTSRQHLKQPRSRRAHSPTTVLTMRVLTTFVI